MLAPLKPFVGSIGGAGSSASVRFMSAIERVKEGEGGEPQKTKASAPMHLGDLFTSAEPESNSRMSPEAGPVPLFSESLSYELNRSLRGAAQLIGAEGKITEQIEPQEAADFLGQNAQMLGRAAGGLLPVLTIAAGTRYGFGKILASDAQAVEHALLKRTAVGLSAAESGATGLLYGSLLAPTEGAAKDDFGSFAFDRAKSGASSGLAFALMSVGSIGLSKLASTKMGVAIGAERLMSIGAVNGIVSGIPGGFANVEADSLVRGGTLDFDREHLGRAMYEMSLFGAVFGLSTGLLARASSAPAYSRADSLPVLPSVSGNVAGFPETAGFADLRRSQAPHDKVPAASNDNFPPAANDNHFRAAHVQETQVAVGDYLVLAPEHAQVMNGHNGRSHFAAVDGGQQPARLGGHGSAEGAGIDGAVGNVSTASRPEQALSIAFRGDRVKQPGSKIASDGTAQEKSHQPSDMNVSQDWSRESLIKAIGNGVTDFSNANLRGLDLRDLKFDRLNLDRTDFTGSQLNGVDFGNAKSVAYATFDAAELADVNFNNTDVSHSSFKGAKNIFRVNFRGAYLDGADFSSSDLENVDFSDALRMDGARFDGADLAGADFSGKSLRRSSFKGAMNLAQVNFRRAVLIDSDFGNSDLKDVDFSGVSYIFGTNFSGAFIDGTNFSLLDLHDAKFRDAHLGKVSFDGVRLDDADFSSVDLRGVDFSRAIYLRHANFERADLAGANFRGAELEGARFRGAKNLIQVNFENARLDGADFTSGDLRHADFSKARSLVKAIFKEAELEGADFSGRNAAGANFYEANLTGAKFADVSLAHADFKYADLKNADFRGVKTLENARFDLADLSGADLSGANLVNTSFVGATSVSLAKFDGANLKDANFLSSDLKLSTYFAHGSHLMQQLERITALSNVSMELAKFIVTNPALHKQVLESEISRMSSAKYSRELLSAERFDAFTKLQQHYGRDSDTMRVLTDFENSRIFFTELEKFINQDPQTNYDLVSQVAHRAGSAEQLAPPRLSALRKLGGYLEDTPKALQQLLDLESSGDVTLLSLASFIQENPVAHKQIVLQELEREAGGAKVFGQFDYHRLRSLSSLTGWFGENSQMMQSILKLEREGLALEELADLLNQDAVKQVHVQTLIAKGAPIEQVRQALENDCIGLANVLGPAESQFMNELIAKRLRVGQLRTFIADNPVDRLGLVEDLIRSRETVERFHAQMDLAMLPDDVSRSLIDSRSVQVPQIIAPMLNWQSGSQFRDLLIEKVRSGEAVSPLDLKALSLRAQELVRSMPVDKQGDVTAQFNAQGKGATARSALETVFPITNPRAIKAASIMNEAVAQILQQIPADKTIVVLGRDALPLYPALRHSGRNAQYFLWSRLQGGDEATAKQWLQEVAPGAVAIDTGYAGSILDAINKIDPTTDAYLLSSSSKYPQLLKSDDHSAVVDNLEYFPKLVGRVKTYTGKGGAVSRKGNTDEHDDATTDRWTVESLNRQFLRAFGLNEWGVWRYSRYTGLKPEERLGLNTREEVEQHYARIRDLRAATARNGNH